VYGVGRLCPCEIDPVTPVPSSDAERVLPGEECPQDHLRTGIDVSHQKEKNEGYNELQMSELPFARDHVGIPTEDEDGLPVSASPRKNPLGMRRHH